MNNKEKTSSRGNKMLPRIILIVVGIVLLGITGYVVYEKILKDNDQVEEDYLPTDEEKQIMAHLQAKLDEGIYSDIAAIGKIEIKEMNIKLNNQLKLWLSVNDKMTSEQIDKLIKEKYGQDVTVIHEDVNCLTDGKGKAYLYDSKTKTYSLNKIHSHGRIGYMDALKVVTLTIDKTNGLYIANAKAIYGNICFDVCSPHVTQLYTDYTRKNKIDTKDLSLDKLSNDDLFDKLYNELPDVILIFEKVGNNYALISVQF